MATITIDGRAYDIPEEFTLGEVRAIKTWTGIRAGEIAEALEAQDVDILLAVAAIAMNRAGHKTTPEAFYDMGVTALVFSGDDEPGGSNGGPPSDAAAAAAKPARKTRARSGAPGS